MNSRTCEAFGCQLLLLCCVVLAPLRGGCVWAGPANGGTGERAATQPAAQADELAAEAADLAAKSDYPQAIEKMKGCLQARQQAPRPDELQIAKDQEELGHLYLLHEDYGEAKTSFLEAIPVFEKAKAVPAEDLCLSRLWLSAAYAKLGEAANADDLFAKCNQALKQLTEAAERAEQRGDFRQCEKDVRAILRIDREAASSPLTVGADWYMLAEALQYQDKCNEAMGPVQKAIEIFQSLNPPRPHYLGVALQSKCKIQLARGETEEAKALAAQAKVAYARDPQSTPLELALVDCDLATIYGCTGPLTESERILVKVLPVLRREAPPTDPDLLKNLENLRSIEVYLGKKREAAALLDEIVGAVEKLPPGDPSRRFYMNRTGHAYCDAGDFAKAKDLFEDEIKACKPGDPDIGTFQQGLATIYIETGDYAKAAGILRASLDDLDRQGGPASHRVAIQHNLAVVALVTKDCVAAERLFREELDWDNANLPAEHPDTALTQHGLACALIDLQRYHEAESLCLQAAQSMRKWDHPELVGVLTALCTVYLRQGENAKAAAAALEAVENAERRLPETASASLQARTNYLLCMIASGRLDEAADRAKQLLASHERLLGACSVFQSERQQLAMLSLVRIDLDNYLSVAGPRSLPADEVYQHVLDWKGGVTRRQARSRQFRAALASGDETSKKSVAQLQELSLRLEFLHNSPPEKNPQRLAAQNAEIASLLARSEELAVLLARKGATPASGPARPGEPLDPTEGRTTLASLQRSLAEAAPKTALVDFLEYKQVSAGAAGALSEPRLSAFVVQAGAPVRWVDLGPSQEISRLIDDWRAAVAKGWAPVSAGKKLREAVLDKLPAELNGVHVLLYSPDGPLCRLPLAALPGSKPDSYFADDVSAVLIPVPAQLPEILASAPDHRPDLEKERHSLLVVGDVDYGRAAAGPRIDLASLDRSAPRMGRTDSYRPLTGSGPAMQAIRDQFTADFPGAACDVLRGEQATKAAYVATAPAHAWQVLITHGFFAAPPGGASPGALLSSSFSPGDDQLTRWEPRLLSGLAFAGANLTPDSARDDGILTALTVSELDLSKTDLVVLAACESGLGVTADGEGVLGLQRAYQLAGARSVLASQWQVSEKATLAFLTRFHHDLWEGQTEGKRRSKLEALVSSQEWMRKNYHPSAEELGMGPINVAAQPIAPGVGEPKPSGDGPLPPFFWAAFTLSGDWR